MEIGKKLIILLLVFTIGVSLFIGLTLAAPRNRPSNLVMLGSHSDSSYFETNDWYNQTRIASDKPTI